MIDEELLGILACPVCKHSVQLIENHLICMECRRKYPIRNGIPVMLIQESKPIEKDGMER